MKKMTGCLIAAIVTAAAGSVRAEDGEWQFKLTPYAWAAGIEGDVGLGHVTAPVDVDFLDALEDLELAGMLSGEAHNGTWGILADGVYMRLNDDTDTAIGNVDVELEQWILQGSAVYRVSQNEKTVVDVGAGGRFMSIDTDINTATEDAEGTEDWGDPIIVARVRQQFAENCFGVLYGDIGGFGVSSEMTWQLLAAAGYSFTDKFSMLLGYRYLDYDYDQDGFVYDVATSGLALGLQFDL